GSVSMKYSVKGTLLSSNLWRNSAQYSQSVSEYMTMRAREKSTSRSLVGMACAELASRPAGVPRSHWDAGDTATRPATAAAATRTMANFQELPACAGTILPGPLAGLAVVLTLA